MKNFLRLLIITTLANVIWCSIVGAQEKFTEGKKIIGNQSFETKFLESSMNRMVVITKLPQFKNGYPLPTSPTPPLPIRSGDMEVDTVVDRNIFFDVLKSKLDALNTNKEVVIINYVFDHDGNILDISSYGFPKNTLITPKELYMIDKRLRKEVKATFKGREYLEHPVIFYGREIRF
ncbi:hypothetical protein ACFOET_11030 [Parapedobacter deserti]|uniref:TonB C-terminal domain-containing protein n=1 Tax=Parapedobacter deserti TaxID=1912957 RepID=A0ABV7JJI1_9SPHI